MQYFSLDLALKINGIKIKAECFSLQCAQFFFATPLCDITRNKNCVFLKKSCALP